jgi:hypothetical protein
MKGFEVAVIESRRGRERFEDAADAGEFAIEGGRVDASRVEQPTLGGRPVAVERTPDEDARQQRAGQHGAENQNEQVNPDRTQPG